MTPAELRRRIARLRQVPGLTRRPVCPACGREVAPKDFGPTYCKPCHAEMDRASDDYHARMLDETFIPPAPLSDPFGDGSQPFLLEEEK